MFLSMMSFGILTVRACARRSRSRLLSEPGPPARTAWMINLQKQELSLCCFAMSSGESILEKCQAPWTCEDAIPQTHFPNLPYNFARAPSDLFCADVRDGQE